MVFCFLLPKRKEFYDNFKVSQTSESYLALISLGQDLQKIQKASFLIQLQAINSLVHLARKTEEKSGFSAVSKDLMDFSGKMSKRTEELAKQLQDLLKKTTSLQKSKRFSRLLGKSGPASLSTQESLAKTQLNINSELFLARRSLIQKVDESVRLCKIGNVIVVCSKIEAAYMKSESSIYQKLSEEVNNSIDSIAESFQNMKSILSNSK